MTSNVGYESVLCIYNQEGQLIGFYRNDMQARTIKIYNAQELGLEEIKDMHGKMGVVEKIKPKDHE